MAINRLNNPVSGVTALGTMMTGAGLNICALVVGIALAADPMTSPAQVTRPSTEVIEATGNGQINWTDGWVQAIGTGYGPANAPPSLSRTLGERAGYAIALRNLLEVIKGVRVDSESFVKGHMDDDQVIRTKVSGLVQGAQIVQSSMRDDGGIEVRVKAPLWGIGSESLIAMFEGAPGRSADSSSPLATDAAVLIDARGLGTTPALLPVIVNEQGKQLYNPSNVDPKLLERSGPAKYYSLSKDIDLQSFLFPNVYVIRPVTRRSDVVLPFNVSMPLSVRGRHAAGTLRSTLVIGMEDSARLDRDETAMSAFSRGNIIIVIDPLESDASASTRS